MPVRQPTGHRHHAYAYRQPEDLRGGLFEAEAFLQLGNQVCQRHVDEAAAHDDQEVGQVVLQLVDQPVAHQTAQRGDGAGKRNFDQCHAFIAAALVEHHQIAHVVRDFMGQHGQRGDDAQAQVSHEGGGDEHAVAKAVHAVTGEQRPAAGFWEMRMVSVVVALVGTMCLMNGAIDGAV